jgi:5-(carboxyamino)imidazole ribonucleotide mutase
MPRPQYALAFMSPENTNPAPRVGVVMGSTSDWEVMRGAPDTLERLGVGSDVRVLSAHRTPDALFAWVESAEERGLQVLIAGAGGAAHLPGVVAAKTLLPVLGVPMQTPSLGGLDSLLSIVQMPGGVPVGTLGIGKAGAVNAALLAARILARSDPAVATSLAGYVDEQARKILATGDPRDANA